MLSNCNFRESFIRETELKKTEFRNIDFSGVDFSHTSLCGIDLSECILGGIYLSEKMHELRGCRITAFQAVDLVSVLGAIVI